MLAVIFVIMFSVWILQHFSSIYRIIFTPKFLLRNFSLQNAPCAFCNFSTKAHQIRFIYLQLWVLNSNMVSELQHFVDWVGFVFNKISPRFSCLVSTFDYSRVNCGCSFKQSKCAEVEGVACESILYSSDSEFFSAHLIAINRFSLCWFFSKV